MKKCSMCGKDAVYIGGVCPDCLQAAVSDGEQLRRMKQLNSIMEIAEGTDGNVKGCIENIMEIAGGLDVEA